MSQSGKKDIISPKLMFEGAATLIVALAINNTVREIIEYIWPRDLNGSNKIIANIVYTITIIVSILIIIYLINKFNNTYERYVVSRKSRAVSENNRRRY